MVHAGEGPVCVPVCARGTRWKSPVPAAGGRGLPCRNPLGQQESVYSLCTQVLPSAPAAAELAEGERHAGCPCRAHPQTGADREKQCLPEPLARDPEVPPGPFSLDRPAKSSPVDILLSVQQPFPARHLDGCCLCPLCHPHTGRGHGQRPARTQAVQRPLQGHRTRKPNPGDLPQVNMAAVDGQDSRREPPEGLAATRSHARHPALPSSCEVPPSTPRPRA